MKIVAFLQNCYSRCPTHPLAKRYVTDAEYRKKCLGRSATGWRLRRYLGEDLFDLIYWDNASPQIGSHTRATFPPDPEHIIQVVNRERPYLILCFGNVALEGVTSCVAAFAPNGGSLTIIHMSHPSARGLTRAEMLTWRHEVVKYLALHNSSHQPQ